MVCLGYAEGTKGYKMYDLVAKRVHLSRDVIFEENRGWDWNTNSDIQNRPDFL
jgi:N-acyl-L-homoserine lactone synthetase